MEKEILEILKSMQNDMKSMQNDIKRLESKVDNLTQTTEVIYDRTAGLSEFENKTEASLNEINEKFEFLVHKEQKTEMDLFSIKRKLEVIK